MTNTDPNTALEQHLVGNGRVAAGEWTRIVKLWQRQSNGAALPGFLVRYGAVSELDMATALSSIHHAPLVRLDEESVSEAPDVKLSQRFLKESQVLPQVATDGQLLLVMADPGDDVAANAVSIACGQPVARRTGLATEIELAIERVFGQGKSQLGRILDDVSVQEDELPQDDADHLKDLASEAPVVKLVNLFFRRAQELEASDIHLEPFENQLKVRYRVDGVLRNFESPPATLAAAVISRIKLMAKLNIAERRLPQDGRIRLRLEGEDLDVRVSTVPTMHGESVVMRLLHRGDVILDLGSLGFAEDTMAVFKSVLARPHGMLVVTGPTGSGKTTTLYTALNLLNSDERKILTVEDPVEYELEGVNQIQVKPSIELTFANALRSIVRQDPDVIMVGEMRDLETAKICVQSALTGHLVLSTLHTNNAAGCVTRLMEMGVEDYLLTSTLNAVIGQRLVRLLCPECREAYQPLPEFLESTGLANYVATGTTTLYRPSGCKSCNGTGFKGRLAIVELLNIDEEIRRLALKHADENQIQQAAVQSGMRTMFADGCSKVLAGLTTIDEVARVTRDY